MGKKPKTFITNSRWVKYSAKDKLQLPVRKRNYLYWFKFLQYAERDIGKVDWSKYKGWGGSNYILASKFDTFWNDNWVKLFSVKKEGDTPKFALSTKQPKTDSYRYALLVYEYRNKGTNWEIAQKIVKRENTKRGLGMTGNAVLFYADEPDKVGKNDKQVIQSMIGRYKRQSSKIIKNVCNGMFP